MSGAYYNENDPAAAATLRELIRRNLIAPGDVDTRSIEDVKPCELSGYTQCHFFAGIGGWSVALRLAGWPDDLRIWTGSCPCQPFSAAGKGNGFADQRHLWPAWLHLISQCAPGRVVGEQVASPDALLWWDLVSADLEGQGYACAAADLCAAGIGAPHIRQRLYWVADTEHRGRKAWESEWLRASAAVSPGASGRLGDSYANAVGRQPGIIQRPEAPASGLRGRSDGLGLAGDVSARRLALADGDGCGARAGNGLHHLEHHAEPCGSAGGMADPHSEAGRSTSGRAVAGSSNASPGAGASELGRHGGDSWASPLHGFWRAADWLGCRDGKWRPVEPGTFPLAHGLPARVGRLRGYGNAIVPQVAAEFIRAYCEVRGI